VGRPADVEVLSFPDGTFDVVYSSGVLHHTPGTQEAIDEIHRALRPGGLAIIGLYHKNSAFYWICTMLLRGVLRGGHPHHHVAPTAATAISAHHVAMSPSSTVTPSVASPRSARWKFSSCSFCPFSTTRVLRPSFLSP